MRRFAIALALLLSVAAPAEAFLNHVPNNTALKALKSFVYPEVMRVGFAAVGDAGTPLLYVPSNAACSLNSGNGDDGSQVKSADGKCWLAQFPSSGIDPRWFGADATGVADSTTAINAAFAAAAMPTGYTQGARQLVQFPSGVFNVTGITIPGITGYGYNGPYVRGQGMGTVINMLAGHTSTCILTIGSITQVNNTSQVEVADLQFTSAAQQVAGGYICAKGSARLILRNIYAFDGHPYDGVQIDGADFHTIDHVLIFGAAHNGFTIWDGYDCGFTATTHTGAAGGVGATTITVPSTTGVSVGMSVFDATRQFQLSGTVTSINPNVSFTMTLNTPIAIVTGDTLVFGGTCGPTGMTFTGDTLVQSATNYGVQIGGGIGGVYADKLHIYSSGFGTLINTALSQGISNREIFLQPGYDSDSNTNQALYVAPNSITRLVCTGCWNTASISSGAVLISVPKPEL